MDNSLNVLIADDEPIILKSMARYLGAKHCRIVACDNGNEALRKATSSAFDVVIADLELPVAKGASLVESLLDAHLDCRIIVISGHAERPESLAARSTPGMCYLAKPFDLDALARIVLSGQAPT